MCLPMPPSWPEVLENTVVSFTSLQLLLSYAMLLHLLNLSSNSGVNFASILKVPGLRIPDPGVDSLSNPFFILLFRLKAILLSLFLNYLSVQDYAHRASDLQRSGKGGILSVI